MFAIYKKELHSYFTGVMGWIFLAAIFLLVGLYHWAINLTQGLNSFTYAFSGCIVYIVLFIPIFTMRSMAEEAHQKTDQLLYTSPVSITGIVLGKYLSMITILFMASAVLALYPVTLMSYGPVNLSEDLLAILVFFLMGSTYISMGLFVSSLVENQILAAVFTEIMFIFTAFSSSIGSLIPTDNLTALVVVTCLLLILFLVVMALTKNVPFAGLVFAVLEIIAVLIYLIKPDRYDGLMVKLFGSFAVLDHMANGINSIVSLSDFVYFISVTALFIFLTVQSVNKKRWS